MSGQGADREQTGSRVSAGSDGSVGARTCKGLNYVAVRNFKTIVKADCNSLEDMIIYEEVCMYPWQAGYKVIRLALWHFPGKNLKQI